MDIRPSEDKQANSRIYKGYNVATINKLASMLQQQTPRNKINNIIILNLMKNENKITMIFFLIIFSFNCNIVRCQKFIKFDQIPPSAVIKKAPSTIYQSKKEINVILRNSSYDFTKDDQEEGITTYNKRLLFNTIEKEFIRYGLNVKDAALYELDKSSTNNNVDLLVDLAAREPVRYRTNYVVNKNEDKKSNDVEDLVLIGCRYDFRITDPRNNEVLGYYTFNFVPCTQGCQIKIHRAGVNRVEFVDKKYTRYKGMYETSEDRDEKYTEFCKMVASYLINELKKNTEVESLVDESEDLFSKAKKNVYRYFPVSFFEDNGMQGVIQKDKPIYLTYYIYNDRGENISELIKEVLTKRGYKVTDQVGKAGYFLFYYKGKMIKTGFDRECMQFQFINAKTLEKLSSASYKFRRGDYEEDTINYFIDSL